MSNQMLRLEDPEHERPKVTRHQYGPSRQETTEATEATREEARTSQAHSSISLDAEALQSLALVNGLEPLEDVCRRYDIRLTAKGSVVRRLVESPSKSIFELARFLSDLDLVHSGPAERTEEIKAAILTEVPFGETLRLQVRSEADDERFRIAAAHSGIVPAATLHLSTDGGLRDPWNGVQDIVQGQYRYIKNGYFKDSPLYRAGRDLDVLSVLLYFRVILESATWATNEPPGLGDALRVVNETVASGEALDMVRRNPELAARLVYFLFGLKAARPTEMHGDHGVYDGLGLDRLATYFSGYPVVNEAFSQLFRPLTAGSSLVASAHLAGGQFRFDFSPEQSWTDNAEDIREQLSSVVNAFRAGVQASPDLAPPTFDDGLVPVAASPVLRMRAGQSPSSGTANGPAGVHEFVHVITKVEPENYYYAFDSEDLSVIVAVHDHNKLRWVTTVPSYCRSEVHPDGMYLFIRCNLGGIGHAVADGALQVFVLGWEGRQSVLRRL